MKGYEMNAAPERIWIKPTYLSDDPDDFYLANPKYLTGREAEYVLASRLAEVEAERDEAYARELVAADVAVGYLEERDHFAREVERLREALRLMIYETTHLSPEEDDGSHWCRISKDALAHARAALNPPVSP